VLHLFADAMGRKKGGAPRGRKERNSGSLALAAGREEGFGKRLKPKEKGEGKGGAAITPCEFSDRGALFFILLHQYTKKESLLLCGREKGGNTGVFHLLPVTVRVSRRGRDGDRPIYFTGGGKEGETSAILPSNKRQTGKWEKSRISFFFNTAAARGLSAKRREVDIKRRKKNSATLLSTRPRVDHGSVGEKRKNGM